tara:strand:- start:247 stop:459 length:213 start_codon:yes stop_codon:yes gene_type:complete
MTKDEFTSFLKWFEKRDIDTMDEFIIKMARFPKPIREVLNRKCPTLKEQITPDQMEALFIWLSREDSAQA